MKRNTTKRYYEIHSWVGALTAIMIFVLAYTGSVSVFGRPELKIWANESIHVPVGHPPEAIEDLVRKRAADVPVEYLDEIVVLFPGVRRSANLVLYFEHESELENGGTRHHIIRFDHDPTTLELISRREGEPLELFETDRKDMADFIIKFHADLHLGDPWGLLLTGLLGLTLLASIVTGVITHRKVLKEAFTFRPFRSLRLLFTDSHKALGIWGLAFHAVISFTGAFLGLAVVILFPAAAYVSFQGDVEALAEEFLPMDEPARSGVAADLNVADVLYSVQDSDEGPVVSAVLLGGRDANAVVVVNTLAGKGIVGSTLRYKADTAELQTRYTTFSRLGGAAGPVLDAMFPLHFGNFGGVAVKYLWFILGLTTGLLAVTGSMIWIERRVYGTSGNLSHKSYRRISRLTVGACCGVVIAVACLFHAQLLLDVAPQKLGTWLGILFFTSWAASIVWALFRSNDYQTTRELIAVAGALYAVVPLVNGAVTGNHILNAIADSHIVAGGTDLTLLIGGIALLATAYRLPNQRPLRKGKYGGATKPPADADVVEVSA